MARNEPEWPRSNQKTQQSAKKNKKETERLEMNQKGHETARMASGQPGNSNLNDNPAARMLIVKKKQNMASISNKMKNRQFTTSAFQWDK
jgi:hypothetical protein